jgi:glutaminyl-peptide cyclotransferase
MSRLVIASSLVLVAALLSLGGFGVLQTKSERDAFAQDRDVGGGQQPARFDADRAMGYLQELCRIGPRISGTAGMTKQQDFLRKHFESLGAKVELQRFTARQASRRESVEMANLIVSWHPDRQRRVLLCSHYDTRPIADQEPDRRKWHEQFLSANDGGSGVVLLMELANHLKELKTGVGIDFVFFDGEEYIFDPDRDKYFLGSEHFARTYRRALAQSSSRAEARPSRYVAAVLLDMIGGKGAHFPAENHSFFKAGPLVQEIWGIAAELKCTSFQNRVGQAVLDDHLALNDAGIPAVDIIDFDYPHWHRLTDTPDNCSGESLGQVAQVLTVWMQRVK